jgi:crotonobetainyl-CoA:carnitine CoA-transferase CaiB-like acyl-CoA transferase
MGKDISNVRVVELGGYLAAPFAGFILGRLGADVIKVEPPTGEPGRVFRSTFVCANAGKRAVVLNLKEPQARDLWAALVRSADVIVQNLSDAATADLGIGYEKCRELNRDIVYCDIRAFGAGPYEGRLATNPLIEALTGLMSITWAEGKPTRQASAFFDQMAGLFAALGIVAELNRKGRPESSGYVEIDLFETGLLSVGSRLAHASANEQLGGETWGMAPYDTFATADGKWIFVGVNNDRFWQSFCRVMNLALAAERRDLATARQRALHRAEVNDIAAEAIRALTRAEVFSRLASVDVPCAPVNDFSEVMRDEHVRFAGKLQSVKFDDLDLLVPSIPMTGSIVSGAAMQDPPNLGQHSQEVFESLGFGRPLLEELDKNGVIIMSKDPLEARALDADG